MKWKFCEFCYINGHCENQDRGHKCECYGKKLEDKCERLEKQLNLALRGLQEYAKEENWHSIYDTESFDWQPLYYSRKWKEDFGYMYAQDMLLKIKDIKK